MGRKGEEAGDVPSVAERMAERLGKVTAVPSSSSSSSSSSRPGKNKEEERVKKRLERKLLKALKQKKRSRPLLEKARREVGKKTQEAKNVSLLLYTSKKRMNTGK